MFQKINQIAGKRSLMPPTKYIKSEDGRILQDPQRRLEAMAGAYRGPLLYTMTKKVKI